MVASIRCEEISKDQLSALAKDQAWITLLHASSEGLVSNFGQRAASLMSSCLAGSAIWALCESILTVWCTIYAGQQGMMKRRATLRRA